MLNKFKIAEAENFSTQMSHSKYRAIARKINDFVYPQLRENPFYGANIKKLKGEFSNIYRYRVGKYRIFYSIEKNQLLVLMIEIQDRKDAY